MLVTTSKQGANRLQEKGTYRKKGGASGILGMHPAGTGEVVKIKELTEFPVGAHEALRNGATARRRRDERLLRGASG